MTANPVHAPDTSSTSSSGILDLPYDILFELFTLLAATDIVHLLSTSRALRALASDEFIWKHLSARYGLIDITHFGGRSFYSVYAGLLHTYGSLLGLWASDFPYAGEILQFSLDMGSDHRSGGIIGELWKFPALEPEEVGPLEIADLPTYRRIVRIGFGHPISLETQSEPFDGRARLFCCSRWNSGSEHWHMARLNVMSETNQSIFLHTRLGQFPHPEFPDTVEHPWYDAQRPFPRLSQTPQDTVDQTECVIRTLHPRVPTVYTAPGVRTKPRAISITCSDDCFRQQWPFLGFQNDLPFHSRYYPVRADIQPGVEPWSEHWNPLTLSGLWLGAYGLHGTECLHVEWDGAWLRSWKVTGDENVPRGICSWTVQMSDTLPITHAVHDMCVEAFGPLARCRVFHGTGAMSARGFMPHQRDVASVIIGVVGADDMRVLFADDGEVSTCIRYKGRRVP
ncbi:hypothetical protein B0H21DRAFT_567996 [Amylocystis lapponica]|nr:hypothetical protein B0H21DRAFT_567996 [Amylocystis lapponica]